MKRYRESRIPTDNDLAARGTPDPDRKIIRTRRRRKSTPTSMSATPAQRAREIGSTPRSHKRHVERLYAEMLEAQAAVAAARASGDEPARLTAAEYARECRARWQEISGSEPERRVIDVDQGSAVNPMVAV